MAAVALLVLAAAAAFGWAYSEYRKRALHAAVVALVADTSVRLREVVSGGSTPTADQAEVVRKLEGEAAEIDRHLEALRRLNPAPNRALVDAAELYVVTARELARRMASSHRHRVELQQSAAALRALVESVDPRSGSWIEETLRARERAERDYFSYRLAVEAAANLLGSLREATRELGRYADASLLLEERLRAKGEAQAREAARQAADELELARRLAARQ